MNKICIFVVCVDNYFPKITSITLPAIEVYAKKINADFKIIKERKFPEFPPTYEKMQLYDLGIDNDINILLDCDIFITEDMYDVCEIVHENCFGVWMGYDPQLTIKEDELLLLDGTDQIIASNFVLTHKQQHNLWKPLDISSEVALSRMKRLFVIDEYCIGRNIKKYNLSYESLSLPGAENNLFYHGNITTDSLSDDEVIKNWL